MTRLTCDHRGLGLGERCPDCGLRAPTRPNPLDLGDEIALTPYRCYDFDAYGRFRPMCGFAPECHPEYSRP